MILRYKLPFLLSWWSCRLAVRVYLFCVGCDVIDCSCSEDHGLNVGSSVWIPCFLTSHIFLKSCMECKEVWSVDGVKLHSRSRVAVHEKW
ncbi:hypothetical protein CDAR_111361 [Caerostris darwini]|uniref:Secreted protein n=1 Tax=Caerostris darwini TaxID=1538125 RepID=A0AAV4UBU8_9ARAC|nr:hypothetical protein CDAR_111361 [Caerostris darwini]